MYLYCFGHILLSRTISCNCLSYIRGKYILLTSSFVMCIKSGLKCEIKILFLITMSFVCDQSDELLQNNVSTHMQTNSGAVIFVFPVPQFQSDVRLPG